ncbi:Sulfotransferase domain-containing protein [Marinobacter daqiaonensis]|uniref:Sulfotransferase domain-containing protein n=1 Tax=Marinobacter daqiaonensis TaxID=650891 RepID=A0A1I6H3D4_9GAMM|nr:sulfotransferase [Marinobacter daqiaonensis]SFR48976.1 Sulfotransferase domain-containing protein [Marinobacter daqiaonensis]
MPEKIPQDGYLMIIGAMKCGTSSLYDYLQGHPQICPAITKEPEYFSSNQRHGLSLSDYSQLWEFDPGIHRFAMEASTGYSKFPEENGVPQRIHGHGIRPRFVYMVRNPFDRIVSHYNYMLRDVEFRARIVDDHLINTSNYYLQLSQYRHLFPARDFLIVDFEELTSAPALVVRRVCDFLGIDETYRPPTFEVRNQTRVQSLLERALKRSSLGRLSRHVPPTLRQRIQKLLASMSPRRPRLLSPSERAHVLEQLQPDMQKFEQEYGFDIRRWGFESAISNDARAEGRGATVQP